MSFNNKFYKMIVASALVSGLTFVPIVYTFDVDYGLQMGPSVAQAAEVIVIGVGKYAMKDFETLEIAKQRAKAQAVQHALEYAGVYVQTGETGEIINKEIINKICQVIDTKYDVTLMSEYLRVVTATVTVQIDTDEVNKYINGRNTQNKPANQNDTNNNQNKPSVQSSNNIQELTATGEYRYGERESEAEAEEVARSKAMRRIIEQAGVYVESYTTVNNFKVTQDQINTAARAVIKIISDEPTFDHQNHICKVTIKAMVDTDSIGKYFK